MYPFGDTLRGWLARSWDEFGFTILSTWLESRRRWVEVFLYRDAMLTPYWEVAEGSPVVFVLQRGSVGCRPVATECRARREGSVT